MSKMVTLIRVEEGDQGTFGILLIDGEAFCVTLEPPDNHNIPNVSNINPGFYRCKKYHSEKYGWTYEVTDVYGRTYILFHAGNVVRHTKGCILLGQFFGKLRGDRAILNSGNTFRMFMERMEGVEEFKLEIIEPSYARVY